MPLVNSLLTAIVRANGDALVLHAGERPYVVAPTGQSELASRALTLDAVKGMLNELLPREARQSLDELGAVQHDLGAPAFGAGDSFTVVAARGGDDIWIEIRRLRKPVAPPAPAVAPAPEPVAVPMPVPEPVVEVAPQPVSAPVVEPKPQPMEPITEPQPIYAAVDMSAEVETPAVQPERQPEPAFDAVASGPTIEQIEEVEQESYDIGQPAEIHEISLDPRSIVAEEPEPQTRPATVLPISRHPRVEQGPRFTPVLNATGIDRLLRIAAGRGASTLYLSSQSRPSIRVNGEISAIDGEPILSEAEVEALILDMLPDRNSEALRGPEGGEWICDVAEVGRIRCVTFRDHRGAGAIFRMIPARAISADQLALSREIQGLCDEADGIVLVAGPRGSGKSTLLSAFVDLINRTRSDHVITIENQITFVHENHGSLVSQREVRGDRNELLASARSAMRENPDVLVVEDFASPEIVALALEAAQSGHLVLGGVAAHTAIEAIERLIEQTPPERRAKVQLGLAENLRGIVSQVLLRKTRGGRVAARELLLNTSAVAKLIAEGKTSQLPMAIDNGRKHGMVALNEALAAFVQNGIVDSREAYRQAADQQGFLALLKRKGLDTTFVERLA